MNELLELLQKRLVVLPVWGWLLLGAHQLWRRLNELPRPTPVARMEWGPKPLEYGVRYPQRWKIAGSGSATVVRFLGELLGVTLEEVEALLTKYFLLAGRSTGQVGIGSTAAKGNLTLESTSNAEKGSILFGVLAAWNETQVRWGIGTATPGATLDVTVPNAPVSTSSSPPAAQKGIKVGGGTGAESTAIGGVKGGEGSGTTITSGPGGICPAATVSGTGGSGGTVLISTAVAALLEAKCTGLVKGSRGGPITIQTAAGAGAVNTGTGTAEGGESGPLEFATGKGGAGTTKPGPSAKILFKTGAPGAVVPGVEGNTGPITFEVGNANGTGKAGNITFGGGLGGTEGTGSEIIFRTGKEAATTKLQISQSGMGFFGAAPVAQAPAITKSAENLKEVTEKLNQLIKAIAAAEGGIGISA